MKPGTEEAQSQLEAEVLHPALSFHKQLLTHYA